jgi:tRNA threonylcarbamoyladenosine biosynthesis protein TsaB
MRVLGLDTATRATSVALLDTERPEAAVERRDDPPARARPRHTTRLLELCQAVLDEAGLGYGDVDRLAVGVGPGTFTGLRIGIATALGLAQARGLAVVPVSTLHALAAAAAPDARAQGLADVVAVLDARRGEAFAAAWSADRAADPDAPPWLAPAALAPAGLTGALAGRGHGLLAVGDGAIAFQEALAPSGCRVPEELSERHRVSAITHCRLAAGSDPVPPQAVRPEYLRLPDAEISLRAAQR